MTRARFDPTINLGHILTASVFLFTMGGLWYVTDHRLAAVERQIQQLSVVIIEQARFSEWRSQTDRRLDRLESR
jgi:hypothetical protein